MVYLTVNDDQSSEIRGKIYQICANFQDFPTKMALLIRPHRSIDYRCDNMHFWLSAHNCQVPTPTFLNLEVEQQIRIFGAD